MRRPRLRGRRTAKTAKLPRPSPRGARGLSINRSNAEVSDRSQPATMVDLSQAEQAGSGSLDRPLANGVGEGFRSIWQI